MLVRRQRRLDATKEKSFVDRLKKDIDRIRPKKLQPLFDLEQLSRNFVSPIVPTPRTRNYLREKRKSSGFARSVTYFDRFAAASAVFISLEHSLAHRSTISCPARM